MAKSLAPQDCYALINAIAKEVTGQETTLQAVDSSSFVSVGEELWTYGTENVLNAVSLVLGRTMIAVRPYKATLNLINSIDTGMFTDRIRKISYYSRFALPSGEFNTNLYTNLANGFTNGQNPDANDDPQSTKSQWEQNQAIPLERNFASQNVWQFCITIYENALKKAFRGEAEFNEFVSGIMTEHANDIETQKEAFNRMIILNFIAMVYDIKSYGPQAVNLTAEFNAEFGTQYTSEELRSTYLTDFMKFLTARIKLDSDKLVNRSKKAHWSPDITKGGVTYSLLRHTPKDKQRLLLHSPLMTKAQSYVFPEIFNPEYLKVENYEGVMFWQNEANPSKIDVIPAIPDVTGLTHVQTAGDEVKLDYVVGLLYDVDAMMSNFQLEEVRSTPVEARKGYRNVWLSVSRGAISDPTENAILYYMADPEVTPGE